jgi:hypothetical protein
VEIAEVPRNRERSVEQDAAEEDDNLGEEDEVRHGCGCGFARHEQRKLSTSGVQDGERP